MKKLFISVPMKNRTAEDIRKSYEKMHKIAEIVFDEELEVVSSFIEDAPPQNVRKDIWYLGESIKKLSQADYFIGINYSEKFIGCNIEREAARCYGITRFIVNLDALLPNAAINEKTIYEANNMKYLNF